MRRLWVLPVQNALVSFGVVPLVLGYTRFENVQVTRIIYKLHHFVVPLSPPLLPTRRVSSLVLHEFVGGSVPNP